MYLGLSPERSIVTSRKSKVSAYNNDRQCLRRNAAKYRCGYNCEESNWWGGMEEEAVLRSFLLQSPPDYIEVLLPSNVRFTAWLLDGQSSCDSDSDSVQIGMHTARMHAWGWRAIDVQ